MENIQTPEEKGKSPEVKTFDQQQSEVKLDETGKKDPGKDGDSVSKSPEPEKSATEAIVSKPSENSSEEEKTSFIAGIIQAAVFVLVIIAGLFARELSDWIAPPRDERSPQEILVSESDKMNMTLPIELTPGTELFFTRVNPGMEIVYSIRPISMQTPATRELFRNSVLPQIRETVLSKPEAAEMFERGISYRYQFYDNDGNVVDEETIKKGDELKIQDLMH